MPELPEVEVTRKGLAPRLTGRRVASVAVRVPALRYPLPAHLATKLAGRTLLGIHRRGKYLLLDFGNGHLLLHLGMSGSLRLAPRSERPQKHDHLDIVFGDEVLRLHDPRRFGAALWVEGDPTQHPLLASLGVEPLSRDFTAAGLAGKLSGRRTAIKPAIMDAGIVVGIGNIYASETLYRAGIDPRTPAGRVSVPRLGKLVPAIKETLRSAIRAGGSTLRDYFRCDGTAGDFQLRHRVYARAEQPCRRCGTPILALRQANRATYYCPRCQR
jgi:formamidopyrimidine-DNA glycosylase